MKHYVLGIVVACGVAIAAVDALLLSDPAKSKRNADETIVASSAVLNDDFQERITRESTWRNNRASNWTPPGQNSRNRPSRLQGPQPEPTPSWFVAPPSSPWGNPQLAFPPNGQPTMSKSAKQVSGYRTVCVRTCDGYFFPISFGASEASFSRDQATCSNACPGAKLFYYRPGSQEPEDMVDLFGQKYSRSTNADLFRTQYVESCKCKPHPWEQEATDKHRIYALEDQRRKGNRAVVAELNELKSKNRLDPRETYRRRVQERRRGSNRENVVDVPVSPAPAMAQSTAPRSDVSRGQGSLTQPSTVMTGSLTTAASAATVAAVTVAPPATPTIAETEKTAIGAPIAPMPAVGNSDASPGSLPTVLGPTPIDAPVPIAGPEAIDEPVAIPKAKQRTSGRERSRQPGMMRLGRESQAGAAQTYAPPRNRSTDWTRAVFGQ